MVPSVAYTDPSTGALSRFGSKVITMAKEIDLKDAINAVSDVVQNRPRPIREFDQIYMKTGDMVMQSEFVAKWAENKRLAFIGDGDSISVCVAYLKAREIIPYGPSRIMVFDFDERIVNAIKRFADKMRLEQLDATLYNCLDAFPEGNKYDAFYTNPPWGEWNNGESVNVFAQRGMEAIGYDGNGMIVIADDEELPWPKQVLGRVQSFAVERGFYISRMQPQLHVYHLDADLRSCNLIVSSVPSRSQNRPSEKITDQERLNNFYGRSKVPRVRYVRERKRLNYGMAQEDEYQLELLDGSKS